MALYFVLHNYSGLLFCSPVTPFTNRLINVRCKGCNCGYFSQDFSLAVRKHTSLSINSSPHTFSTGHQAKFLVNDAEVIQREIMTNGPVVAGFQVFTDFVNPGKEVYIHKSGILRGYHAVRVIGWGVQNVSDQRVPFWLVANSWGTQWGDGGVFRILRGSNHCQIESMIVAD